MHHDNAAEHTGADDEVVTEFDQTNGKAPGLEGDSDLDDDANPEFADDGAADGSADDRREPLLTTLVEDLTDGGSNEQRRD